MWKYIVCWRYYCATQWPKGDEAHKAGPGGTQYLKSSSSKDRFATIQLSIYTYTHIHTTLQLLHCKLCSDNCWIVHIQPKPISGYMKRWFHLLVQSNMWVSLLSFKDKRYRVLYICISDTLTQSGIVFSVFKQVNGYVYNCEQLCEAVVHSSDFN